LHELEDSAFADSCGGDPGPEIAVEEVGRRLLARRMSKTARTGSPASSSLMAGNLRPSWKISLASLEIDPGTIPPTSFQCAMFAVQATSSPSTNTGSATTTSFRWVTPP